MVPLEFKLPEAMAVLERTPAALRALLNGLPDAWIHATEGNGTWSPHDVVSHLVHAERTNWIPRAKHILAEEKRPFDTFDRTAYFSESKTLSIDTLLTRFSAERESSLTHLKNMNLSVQDLERAGVHPDLGEVKLRQLLATWTVHDLDHTAQIVRTMARCYSAAVGPWSAYLRSTRK